MKDSSLPKKMILNVAENIAPKINRTEINKNARK